MKRSLYLSLVLFGVAAAGASFFLRAPVPHVSGKLYQEAYVWQRSWSEPVCQAVAQASGRLNGMVVLGAEVSWNRGRARIVSVPVDFRLLKETQTPIGIALRIGAYPGPFTEAGAPIDTLTSLAASLVARARAAEVPVKELQIDFDCAESKLEGYGVWLRAIQRSVAPVPVTFTALPSWLDRASFAKLAGSVGSYVLQVHSLERPAGVDAPLTLCEPQDIKRWVQQAARIGRPFKVALPTYGYHVMFDRNGAFAGLSAEGASMVLPAGGTVRSVRADSAVMADFVAGWTTRRPAVMEGIIWYRLPTKADRLNWSWKTMCAVMEGRSPAPALYIEAVEREPGLVEIVLSNTGEADAAPVKTMSIKWPSARLIAGDGLRGYLLMDQSSLNVTLQRPAEENLVRLRPGDHWTVGWLRFNRNTGVDIRVVP